MHTLHVFVLVVVGPQVVAAAGSCMGGGTSINQGIWILETPQWLIENVNEVAPDEDFFDEDTILDAFQWVTEVRDSTALTGQPLLNSSKIPFAHKSQIRTVLKLESCARANRRGAWLRD